MPPDVLVHDSVYLSDELLHSISPAVRGRCGHAIGQLSCLQMLYPLWDALHADARKEAAALMCCCAASKAVKSLMVWAADAIKSLDAMGATPLDLAVEADAQRAIAILRSV